MNNIPRNTRTANGLKRGVRIEWDTPKSNPAPKKKFDSIAFLRGCLADKEAYGETERKAFRKIIEEIENLKAEIAGHEEAEWDRRDIDGYEGALGKYMEEKE